MKHIKTVNKANLSATAKKGGCGKCQASCQSACKTSCTVGNQKCANEENRQCADTLISERIECVSALERTFLGKEKKVVMRCSLRRFSQQPLSILKTSGTVNRHAGGSGEFLQFLTAEEGNDT